MFRRHGLGQLLLAFSCSAGVRASFSPLGRLLALLGTGTMSGRVSRRDAFRDCRVAAAVLIGVVIAAGAMDLRDAQRSLHIDRQSCPVEVRQKPHDTESNSKQKKDLHRKFFDNYTDVYKFEAERYAFVKMVGSGFQGSIAHAIDIWTGEMVAIKKISTAFNKRRTAIRALREIKLMRLLKGSDDIVQIRHVLLPTLPRFFKVVYFVMELLDANGYEAREEIGTLKAQEHKHLLFELLRGMHYMHSAGVYHRDIKPVNVLVRGNGGCKYKWADFGLSRVEFELVGGATDHGGYTTGSGPARKYRSPELMVNTTRRWKSGYDIWALGVTFMEMARGQALFPARSRPGHAEEIADLLGNPPPQISSQFSAENRKYFEDVGFRKPRDFVATFPEVDPSLLRVVKQMFHLDVDQRPGTAELLQDTIFDDLRHTVRDGPSDVKAAFVGLETARERPDADTMRSLLYEEMLLYHPHMVNAEGKTPSRRLRRAQRTRLHRTAMRGAAHQARHQQHGVL